MFHYSHKCVTLHFKMMLHQFEIAESYRVGKPVVAAWCYENITLRGWLFFKIRLGIYLVWPHCRQDWRLIIQQDNVSEM